MAQGKRNLPEKSVTDKKSVGRKNKPSSKPSPSGSHSPYSSPSSSESKPQFRASSTRRAVFIRPSTNVNLQSQALAPSQSQAQQTRRSTRHGSVLYRSGALKEVAPELVAIADSAAVQNCQPVLQAHSIAERVKSYFKKQVLLPVSEKVINKQRGSQKEKARRYDRRLSLNRNSAAASRVRREAYTKALEKLLYEQNLELSVLKQEKKNQQMSQAMNQQVNHQVSQEMNQNMNHQTNRNLLDSMISTSYPHGNSNPVGVGGPVSGPSAGFNNPADSTLLPGGDGLSYSSRAVGMLGHPTAETNMMNRALPIGNQLNLTLDTNNVINGPSVPTTMVMSSNLELNHLVPDRAAVARTGPAAIDDSVVDEAIVNLTTRTVDAMNSNNGSVLDGPLNPKEIVGMTVEYFSNNVRIQNEVDEVLNMFPDDLLVGTEDKTEAEKKEEAGEFNWNLDLNLNDLGANGAYGQNIE